MDKENWLLADIETARKLQEEFNREDQSDEIIDRDEQPNITVTTTRTLTSIEINVTNDRIRDEDVGDSYEDLLRLGERLGEVKKRGLKKEEIDELSATSFIDNLNIKFDDLNNILIKNGKKYPIIHKWGHSWLLLDNQQHSIKSCQLVMARSVGDWLVVFK